MPWPTSVTYPLLNWDVSGHEQWQVPYLSALMVSVYHNILQYRLLEETSQTSNRLKHATRWILHHVSHHNPNHIMLNHSTWTKMPPWRSCACHILYLHRIDSEYLIIFRQRACRRSQKSTVPRMSSETPHSLTLKAMLNWCFYCSCFFFLVTVWLSFSFCVLIGNAWTQFWLCSIF